MGLFFFVGKMLLRSSALRSSALRFAQQPAFKNGAVAAKPLMFEQQRTAVSLKELKNRMNTIGTIQKITSSMNKLATSRLKAAREKKENLAEPFLEINMGFLKGKGMEELVGDDLAPVKEKELFIVISTDRGMCGATNSGIIRNVRSLLTESRKNSKVTLAIAGSKGAAGLRRDYIQMFHTNVQELGKKHLSSVDVEPLVQVLDEVTDYDRVRIISNQWESVVASRIMHRMLPNPKNMVDEMKDAYYGYEYDGTDEEELFKNLQEHLAACILYGSLIENNAVKLAARMNSMDNATNNASDMHNKLSLLFNRTRQAGITTELSEIISGAASVAEQDA